MNNKHENYEILNLLGYGLAKFDLEFVDKFGFDSKKMFYEFLVKLGVAETASTIKNRQDLLDPFFDNSRKGWWQKGDTYIHRKELIDNLFGKENSEDYANIVKKYLHENFDLSIDFTVSPIVQSKFKQMQITGFEAELYFMKNYFKIERFKDGVLGDARIFGDGYDFQISLSNPFKYYLAEIKGVRETHGSIRMTSNEFKKALEYKDDYSLVIISNLNDIPKLKEFINPIDMLDFEKKEITNKQVNYHSKNLSW
jgi:hypothetical protein